MIDPDIIAIIKDVAENDPMYDWWGCHWCKDRGRVIFDDKGDRAGYEHAPNCTHREARELLGRLGIPYEVYE